MLPEVSKHRHLVDTCKDIFSFPTCKKHQNKIQCDSFHTYICQNTYNVKCKKNIFSNIYIWHWMIIHTKLDLH